MITVTAYANQPVGVFGLGRAGESAISALLAGGAKLYAWDDKEESRARLSARYGDRLTLKPADQWPWGDLKALVLGPGVPLTHPKPHESVEWAVRNRVPVIGDIELLYRSQPEATYIGITGTNGKSTTTTLIAHILKSCGKTVQVGGNLGTPVLDFEPFEFSSPRRGEVGRGASTENADVSHGRGPPPAGEGGIYVIETSSYQLDLLKTVRFNIAAWLNVTPDHIDRHGDIEGYIAAKKHIFDRQTGEDVAVIAVDDEYSKGIGQWAMGNGERKVILASAHAALPEGIYVEDGILHDRSSLMPNAHGPMPLTSIPTLPGRHNWQNAAVAYGVARAAGCRPDAIYKAMQSFAGLRHRLQLVATICGVRFINDSKATNADATGHALAPYENIYWIAGGKPKEGGIETLAPYFHKIAHAFLIGQAEEPFAATLTDQVAFTRCGDLKTAVEKAAERAFAEKKKDAVVLLSPACASFDQWRDFEERGDAFCAMVENLAKEKAA